MPDGSSRGVGRERAVVSGRECEIGVAQSCRERHDTAAASRARRIGRAAAATASTSSATATGATAAPARRIPDLVRAEHRRLVGHLDARRPRVAAVERAPDTNVPPDVLGEVALVVPVHAYHAVVVHGDRRRHVVRPIDERMRERAIVADDPFRRPGASLVARVRRHDLEPARPEVAPHHVQAVLEQRRTGIGRDVGNHRPLGARAVHPVVADASRVVERLAAIGRRDDLEPIVRRRHRRTGREAAATAAAAPPHSPESACDDRRDK